MATKYRYGIINEDYFTLYTPRAVDEDYDTLEEALAEAARRISDEEGSEYSVVLCYFSKRLECWVESTKGGCITMDGTNWRGNEVIEEAEQKAADEEAKKLIAQHHAAPATKEAE